MAAGETVNLLSQGSGGSTPSPPTIFWDISPSIGALVQLAEQQIPILYVASSNLVSSTICLNKLAGNREGNLTYQEGNKLVYGEPADREFEPHFKLQLNIPH